MPLKLKIPRPGKTPYYSVRGTYLGVYVDKASELTNDPSLCASSPSSKEKSSGANIPRPRPVPTAPHS
jgi:hypothetical protein